MTNGLAVVNNGGGKLVQAQVEKPAPIIKNLDDISRVSKLLAESGFFSDAKSVAQCGVKVLAGYEMGFKAFESMTGIHIISGKPSVGAGLMAARIKSSGKYDYEVLEDSPALCKIAVLEIEFKSDVRDLKRTVAKGTITTEQYKQRLEILAIGVSSFSIEDAKKAGTKNLDKFARNMLFARAVSNAVKWYCPDIFSCSVYVPEELGATVDEDGNVLAEPEQQPRQVYQQPAQQPQEDRGIWENQVLTSIKNKGWEVAQVRDWLVQQIQSRYNGKTQRSQLTVEELKDFCTFIENFQPVQDVEEVPMYDDELQ